MPIKTIDESSQKWQSAVPALPRLHPISRRVQDFLPKKDRCKDCFSLEESKQIPFFKRVVTWLKPVKSFEKPLGFVQKGCDIAQKASIDGAKDLSDALSTVSGIFSITSCLDTIASIEKELGQRGVDEPVKLVKLMLSLLKGVTKSIKWLDKIGIVDLSKESEDNIKASNLYGNVSSSLLTLWQKATAVSSYKELFLSSIKLVMAMLQLGVYLFHSQLIKTILKPFPIGADLVKGGFALNAHYNKYAEGKDSWQMTGLRLGDTLSSIGLSLIALGALSTEITVVLPTLVILLSILQLGCQVSLYYWS